MRTVSDELWDRQTTEIASEAPRRTGPPMWKTSKMRVALRGRNMKDRSSGGKLIRHG